MDQERYDVRMQHLADLRKQQLQLIAKQDPTLTALKRALEQERAIRQMDCAALQAFCARLEAKYGI